MSVSALRKLDDFAGHAKPEVIQAVPRHLKPAPSRAMVWAAPASHIGVSRFALRHTDLS
jgi:hypothetical protein